MKKMMVLWLLSLCIILCGCGKFHNCTVVYIPEEKMDSGSHSLVSESLPLVCTVGSEEEAKEIAELYGIELVEYSLNVATYYTEEDPGEVIARGIEKGWPELHYNNIYRPD